MQLFAVVAHLKESWNWNNILSRPHIFGSQAVSFYRLRAKNPHNMSHWCAFWFPWPKVAAKQSHWSTWIFPSKRAFAILRLSRIQMSGIIIIRLSGTRRLSLQRGRKRSRELRKAWLRARWMLSWTPGSFQRWLLFVQWFQSESWLFKQFKTTQEHPFTPSSPDPGVSALPRGTWRQPGALAGCFDHS